LDLVLRYRFSRRGSWCRADFLRQASTISAATIPDIWQSRFAGEQAVILSLGLSLRFVCSRFAFMFVSVETMKAWPDTGLEPLASAASVLTEISSPSHYGVTE